MVKNKNDLQDFFSYIKNSLPEKVSYKDVSNLCLTLFCTVDFLPDKYQKIKLDKENLANIFSQLSINVNIEPYPPLASVYGASFHNTKDVGHWLEVMASILKLANQPDVEQAKQLLIN